MKPFIPGLRITSIGANDRFSSHPTRPPPKVILVIMPYADAYIYNRVKFTCDIKNGIRSICVVGLEFAKDRNDQYLANVALTFDIKLGGRNQILDNAKLGVMADGKTMVVGIDVYPPSPLALRQTPQRGGNRGVCRPVARAVACRPADSDRSTGDGLRPVQHAQVSSSSSSVGEEQHRYLSRKYPDLP